MQLSADPDRVAAWRAERQRVRDAIPRERSRILAERARRTRRQIIETIAAAGAGHVGGDLSVTDILTTLYFGVLDLDPAATELGDRDCFILSKGHCAVALYVTLAGSGHFPESTLASFMAPDSPLNGHPDRNKVPGVVTNTGPLGHGLPVGVGTALAAKHRGWPARTVVVLGDGELQEGSNWEAFMAGAHFGLDNLTAVIDRNHLQQGAHTEQTIGLDPLDQKLSAFGWEVRTVDGHDHAQLWKALAPAGHGRPVAVIANTVKGYGVSFMEDRVEWHHKVPAAEQVTLALAELSAA
jgi:transketolase